LPWRPKVISLLFSVVAAVAAVVAAVWRSSDSHPDMDDRAGWSTAVLAIFAFAGTNAIGWLIGASTEHSPLPIWPAIVFGAFALAGAYLGLAPLVRRWPFRAPRSVPEVLDDAIRAGRDARDRLVQERLRGFDAAGVAAEWTLRVGNQLHRRFPAIADEFVLAAGDRNAFSGQALLIQTINAKLAVLAKARTGLGGA